MVSGSVKGGQKAQFPEFLRALTGGAAVTIDCDSVPPWFEPRRKCQVSEEVFFYFLEVLPPRWMNGSMFAFGEGCGPFRLFWQHDGRFFGRELTEEETVRFCQLTGTALHQ
jgi:hypothetical protein